MNSKQKFNLRLSQLSLGLVVYTLIVILWGAWVRISHSGDGCGDTWPLCQGQLIPQEALKKTWVEYSHRFTSGLYGILVIVLFFWIRKQMALQNDKSLSSSKKWSFWVLIFMITEALLGAKLVIFRLVSMNDSVWRLVVMSLHQLNSFLLVGFTVRLFCSAFEDKILLKGAVKNTSLEFKKVKEFFGIPVPMFLILILAMTGAWAALSTTLFPSISLLEGLTKDFAADSHYLLKLRVTHPLLGITLGSFMAILFYKKSHEYLPLKDQSLIYHYLYKTAHWTSMALAMGVVVGIVTILTLSPIPLKVFHLAIAHILWSFFVGFYHFYALRKSL